MESPGNFIEVGDSLQVPTFEITIELDEKAEKKITDQHETIIVQANLFGTPKDSVDPKLVTEMGELFLALPRVEISKPGIAKFENVKISKKGYEALADKDFIILINVFSGRKSSSDNLLTCDILQEPMSNVIGKPHVLKGKLIYE